MPNQARSNNDQYKSLEICGVSTSFLIFAMGVACLMISVVKFFNETATECGKEGKPPLLVWIFGTGVAFSIISCAFCRVSSGKGQALAKWILGVSNFFVVVWAIVGIFSILQFHYDEDCREVNPLLWNLAWAVVAVSFLVCCCGGFVGYSVRTAEPDVVHEDVEQPRQSRR